jgi:hypothetical protein
MQVCPPDFLTKLPKIHYREKTASSTNVAETLDICLQKAESRSMSFTLYKYHFKRIKDPNIVDF